ncbi:MAG TPA: hypothetical protein VHG51_03640 [Longimicrobiaceae bacterium]|nr:hypothetical protein [Longimicrobiaceae bacterium]
MRSIRPRLPVVLVPGLALALATCATAAPNGGGGVPPPYARALPCPTTAAEDEEGTIGPGGGSVRAGRARLRVPAGALPGRVRFRLSQPVAPYLFVSVVPDGQRFGGPGAALTLSYAHCTGDLPPADSLALFRWNPRTRQWDELASRADAGLREVTAEIEHLSGYTIGTPSRGGG